ncbi:alternative ribosome rescue aminoacyl-tRNA hydrolase ArfB [Pokkaliibacter sp. CJK22405]|uniref:alternative ribosome rescue aminoacyl-tRNA hydrolase ArfB n=1 Tax=Pokkaliibacter sp. CJK22405 TaxID=3384615 RepID=UPI003984C4C4
MSDSRFSLSAAQAIPVNLGLVLPMSCIDISAIRAQGAGGQHVNKTSTAIYLRANLHHAGWPEFALERVLKYADERITADGIVHIKAQRFRSQAMNREDALERLQELMSQALYKPPVRRATRPSNSQKRKRLDNKKRRSDTKAMRGRVR